MKFLGRGLGCMLAAETPPKLARSGLGKLQLRLHETPIVSTMVVASDSSFLGRGFGIKLAVESPLKLACSGLDRL